MYNLSLGYQEFRLLNFEYTNRKVNKILLIHRTEI